MPAIHDEEPAVLGDLNAVDRVPLVRTGTFRILWRRAPVLDELAVFVELRDARAAVAVADEERAVGQPGDVGRPVEQIPGVASALALGAERHRELAVVGELVNHVQLIVDDPHVLLTIVGVHLDLVRPAPAPHLEQLVVLRPRVHHLAVAIDDEDDVVIAPLPSALLRRLAGRAEAVIISCGGARRGQHAVRRPRVCIWRQRPLAPPRGPDALPALPRDGARPSPPPARAPYPLWAAP